MNHGQDRLRGVLVFLGLFLISLLISSGVYWTGLFEAETSPGQYDTPDCSELKNRVGPLLYEVMCDEEDPPVRTKSE